MRYKYDPKKPDENRNQLEGHWEKYAEKNYMGASCLYVSEGKYLTIKIKIVGIYSRVVYDKATNQGKKVVVAELQGKHGNKQMILNVTNMSRIEASTGTADVKQWPGQTIELGAEYVRAGNGKMVWALRVQTQKKGPN